MPLDSTPDHNSPLTTAGRCGRLTFLAWNLFIAFILMVVLLILVLAMPHTFQAMLSNRDSIVVILLAWIPNLIWFYFYLMFSIKRLHDLNQNGWLCLLNCIPILNLFFGLYLIFCPGTAGGNSYGDPRETKAWESVLAVIYIVVLCILLLGFIANFGQIYSLFFKYS